MVLFRKPRPIFFSFLLQSFTNDGSSSGRPGPEWLLRALRAETSAPREVRRDLLPRYGWRHLRTAGRNRKSPGSGPRSGPRSGFQVKGTGTADPRTGARSLDEAFRLPSGKAGLLLRGVPGNTGRDPSLADGARERSLRGPPVDARERPGRETKCAVP